MRIDPRDGEIQLDGKAEASRGMGECKKAYLALNAERMCSCRATSAKISGAADCARTENSCDGECIINDGAAAAAAAAAAVGALECATAF